MKMLLRNLSLTLLLAGTTLVASAQEDRSGAPAADEAPSPAQDTAKGPLPEEYSCMFCHGETGTLAGDEKTQHLIVTEEKLARDIHWQKGLRCDDCHGGKTKLDDFVDHRNDPSFRAITSPVEIPAFCGRCHSDAKSMRKFRPSPRVDQVAEYWTSGHGQRLKENGDERVATCVSCHGHHNIRAVDDLESPVYPTRVAETCAGCHADEQLMAGRTYHGRPLAHDQFELWSKSVHAQAMMEKGDLSAPTCNDCHGNHGALPPEVGSVANACGTCHAKVSQLFSQTLMKHRFETVNLPGCATCHGNHEIHSPTDEMLGMTNGSICAPCHEDGKYGATLAGANIARQMRSDLETLKQQIATADLKLDEAERLGMEIRAARFQLRNAKDSLTNARSLVHSFAIDPMKEAVDKGLAVGKEVEQKAEEALEEHTFRRVWLAISLVPILLVVGLLLLVIRSMPAPEVG